MERRTLDVFVGGILLATLLVHATWVVLAGTVYLWWTQRNATGPIPASSLRRPATLGGCAGAMVSSVATFVGASKLARELVMHTGQMHHVLLSVFSTAFVLAGLSQLLNALLFGWAISLVAPWIPEGKPSA